MACCGDKSTTRVVFGLMLAFLIIGSLIALIVIGIRVVSPYRESSHFVNTVCHVSETIFPGMLTCDCSTKYTHCSYVMPCVQIRVDYARENGQMEWNATLFDSAYRYPMLQRLIVKCSTDTCYGNGDLNAELRRLRSLIHKYGIGNQSYPCFYNPEDPSQTLLHVIPQWTVLLGLLIPAGIFICSVLWIVVYCVSAERWKEWCQYNRV